MTRFLAEQLSTAHWFDQTSHSQRSSGAPRSSLAEGFAPARAVTPRDRGWQNDHVPGGLAERPNASRLESGRCESVRGFKSLTLRRCIAPRGVDLEHRSRYTGWCDSHSFLA